MGAERAFILPRRGLEVVWLTGSEPLERSRFSASARKRLNEALIAQGVAARTGSRPLRAAADGESVILELPGGATERVDWVLAGTGRKPNTDDRYTALFSRPLIRLRRERPSTAQPPAGRRLEKTTLLTGIIFTP